MDQKKIERINELARASRERALTEAELDEQKTLRQEYISAYRSSMRAQLDSIVVVDEHGKKTPLTPKKQS